MRHLNKKLAIVATATALIGAIGASMAQTDENSKTDPMATPQKVEVNGSGQSIYFLRDQGNSPESDPSAHLMLLKHPVVMTPVAETTTTTTVAQSTTADTTTAMPAAADTSNADNGAAMTTAAPADTSPALAPKADRN